MATPTVKKFSQFQQGGVLQPPNRPVGLEDGVNTIWDANSGGGGNGAQVIKLINGDTTGLAVRDAVRFDPNTHTYVPSLATSAEEAEVFGLVLRIINVGQFEVIQSGYIDPGTPGFNGLNANAAWFLSDVNPGKMTQTPPTTNGYVQKPLFLADSSESGWVVCLEAGMVIGSPAPLGPSSSGPNPNIHQVSQAGNTFSIGQCVRVVGNGIYGLASGANFVAAQSVGVVISNGDPLFTIQFAGYNSGAFINARDATGSIIALESGKFYYLSDVVPGAITPFPPTTPLTARRPIYLCESHTNFTGWIFPAQPILVGASEEDPIVTVVTQVGHNFGLREALYVSAANTYARAIANNPITARAVGIVVGFTDDPDQFVLQSGGLTHGFVPPATPLVAPNLYYLSDTTPGEVTTTVPTTPGNYIKPMVQALNSTSGYILEVEPRAVASSSIGTLKQMVSISNSTPSTVALTANVWANIPGMSGIITPSDVSSRIKLSAQISAFETVASGRKYLRILRNGVPVGIGTGLPLQTYASVGNFFGFPFLYVDSPASVAALTYQLQFMSTVNNTLYMCQDTTGTSSFYSQMILEEIGL